MKTLISLLLCIAFLPLSAQLDKAMQSRIDSLFMPWDKPTSPGFAIGVISGGDLVYAKGYGMATLEYDVPITPKTVFHMASVSKQFTAFAVALLAEEGKLSLDDDIRKHIPELPDFGQKITIRHLIHHTSGLRDQWNLLAMAGWRLDDVITRDQILRLLQRQTELNFAPGAEYVYCNSGYTLMAEIVSRTTGKTFAQWMEERVFKPLGMTSTLFYDDHERIVANRAYSYQPASAGAYKKSVLSYANAGATSLFTTVEDMVKWNNNFRKPLVGSPALIKQMETRGILTKGDTINYAFGQIVEQYKGLPIIQHGGADAGYRTYFLRFPKEDYAFVVLSNLSTANPGGMAMKIADVVLEKRLVKEEVAKTPEKKPEGKPQSVRVSAQSLARCRGAYLISSVGVEITVSMKSDTLHVRQEWDGQEYPILPDSDSSFFVPAGPAEVKFVFHGPGNKQVEQITILQGGNKYEGKRKSEAPTEAAVLSPYSGRYYSAELETFYRIEPADGKLRVHHQRHPHFDLTLVEENKTIGGTWFFNQASFERDPAGKVTGMRVSSGRVRNLYFKKVE